MDLIKLGQILEQKRETIGLPATTVAKRAGIGRTTLWKLERGEDTRTGKPSKISKDKLERLFAVLEINQAEQAELLELADYKINETLLQEPNQPLDKEEKEIAFTFASPIRSHRQEDDLSGEEELLQILDQIE